MADTADMKTKTEQLLEEAKAICQRVTDRLDVSDDLLCSVFRRLELEADLLDEDLDEAAEALAQQHGLMH